MKLRDMRSFSGFKERIITFLIKLFSLKISDKAIESLIQFVKFGIVGVTNTIVGYIANVVTILLLQSYNVSWDYYAGNLLAFILGVLWSFYWNNRFVFKLKEGEKRNLCSTLLKAYASYAFTGLVLNNVLSFLWVDVIGISKMIAPLINMIIGVPINFIMNKLWTFQNKKSG